ncbi:MAG: hypothetical protein M1433_00635 [Candidatus Parvarchaeota archaeon]|nr:hypothetical protein [Candidatus Parvarchaeota archaeon]
MEEEELKKLYERVLENFTLYNQYRNNIEFNEAYELGELLLRINNLAVRNGLYRGDIRGPLSDFEQKLKSDEKNKNVLFI